MTLSFFTPRCDKSWPRFGFWDGWMACACLSLPSVARVYPTLIFLAWVIAVIWTAFNLVKILRWLVARIAEAAR